VSRPKSTREKEKKELKNKGLCLFHSHQRRKTLNGIFKKGKWEKKEIGMTR
jgi:hypothetical protein